MSDDIQVDIEEQKPFQEDEVVEAIEKHSNGVPFKHVRSGILTEASSSDDSIEYSDVEVDAMEVGLQIVVDNSHKEEADPEEGVKNEEEEEVLDTNDDDKRMTKVAAKYVPIVVFTIAFILGFVLCFLEVGGDRKISQTMAIAVWVSALWLTELVPLVVTAFMPLFLFPMFGILSSGEIAGAYINNTIFLFIAGMIMALALERWDLHRRFSFKILSWCGTKPQWLLLGMMTVTFLLSMFVSNTATALMMVPNAISVCESIEKSSRGDMMKQSRSFGIALMLGIAYAANVGGMASLIGTPPNLIFQAQLKLLFPEAPEITFAQWLFFGLPLGGSVMIITWVYLKFLYLRNFHGEAADRQIFVNEYKAMGPWTIEQIMVGALFTLLALLWVFRRDLDFDGFIIPGWANIFPEAKYISDATIGMCFAVLMFVTPARPSMLPGAPDDADTKRSTTLMDWKTANKMPYDIIFLFGGGFALAMGFTESGLSEYLGEILGGMDVSLPAQVFLVVFFISFVTCLTSNTATSSIMIPISAAIALGAGVSPYTFMIPVAFACSCAFCLPVATPPNMVVFASGRLPIKEMMRAGVFLNILCSVLILGATFTIIPAVLGVPADALPEWAMGAV